MAGINLKLLDPYPFGAQPGPVFGCPPVTNHRLRSLTTQFRDPAAVLGDTGFLQGNNTHVYRGVPGTEGAIGTSQPDGLHFDFGFNTPESAETQLFFLTNFLHDFFYDLGFDEAAGNFQAGNFGRGGLEGDALAAVARSTAGKNDSTFEPNPDGQVSIMSMYLWDGGNCWAQDVDGDGSPYIDGDFDTDIAIHEFHHGVSNRLNTQWTGIEADAMGEGGSDFFAYSINNDTTLAEYTYPPERHPEHQRQDVRRLLLLFVLRIRHLRAARQRRGLRRRALGPARALPDRRGWRLAGCRRPDRSISSTWTG